MRQLTMNTYIKHQQARYWKANRKRKSEILNEVCTMLKCHRKHASRVLRHRVVGWREKPLGRKKTYHPEEILEPLKLIWLATNQLCGSRLKAAIPLWLPHFEQAYYPLGGNIKLKLLSMSARTIDRLLNPLRIKYPKRLSGTKPGNLLRYQIPIKTNQWNEDVPGFMEADTVAHCGTSLSGNFVWSLTITDICTGWTENRAMWNKGAHATFEQLSSVEKNLPFPILGFDSDNGGEFINHHLIRYFQERVNPVQFTRSRPYHSGDNAHVEQKNWTHVRQLFGYYRFENPILVKLMNDLYQNELSLLQNYFYPSMKIKDKVRNQSKVHKKYDAPQSPYQRLLNSPHISDEQKQNLRNTFNTLNPFELKKVIESKLKKIFNLAELHLKKKVG